MGSGKRCFMRRVASTPFSSAFPRPSARRRDEARRSSGRLPGHRRPLLRGGGPAGFPAAPPGHPDSRSSSSATKTIIGFIAVPPSEGFLPTEVLYCSMWASGISRWAHLSIGLRTKREHPKRRATSGKGRMLNRPGDDVPPECDGDGLRAVSGPQLRENVADVSLGGLLGDEQLLGLSPCCGHPAPSASAPPSRARSGRPRPAPSATAG